MKIFNGYQPGFSLIHQHVKRLMSNQKDLQIDKREISILRQKIDDYEMYIWLRLGDTRYNKSGYRNAVDKLNQLLNKTTH